MIEYLRVTGMTVLVTMDMPFPLAMCDDALTYGAVLSVLTSRMRTYRLPAVSTILGLIRRARKLLREEPSLLELTGDFTVVGDIHGNIDDLLRVFERRGYPPQVNYLFLGDYVDRGQNSVEVLVMLYSLKILFPSNIYLIRGNHECESVTAVYGFKREVCRRFSVQVYQKFVNSFAHLSFAAVLNGKYFCVHGGLSPDLSLVDEIADIEKPQFSASSGLANDMVWSDPLDVNEFVKSDRGTGWFFGEVALEAFLSGNGLDMLIRSHESCTDGWELPLKKCLTIFSTSDYCGTGNTGAVAVISEGKTDYALEFFKPLSAADKAKRRVIIPDWIFTELGDIRNSMKDPCEFLSEDPLLIDMTECRIGVC
jgi:diadenosine tetraphosphatase ApaH/serine/threonine PP2A family protein phosphatase